MNFPRRAWLLPACLAAAGLALAGCLAPALVGGLAVGGIAAGGAAVGGAAAGTAGAAGAAGAATAGTAAITGVAAATGTAAAVGATGAIAGAGVATGTVAAGTSVGAGIGATAAGAGAAAGGAATGAVAGAGAGVSGSTAGVSALTTAALGTGSQLGSGLTATANGAANPVALARSGLAIGSATRYVPDEIVVANLSPATLERARRLGFTVTEVGLLDHLALAVARLRLPAGRDPTAALAALREGDAVARYELNPVYRLAAAGSATPPNTDCRGLRCYPQTLLAWPGGCGARPRIGMLDSSVDAGHPALAGRRLQRRRFASGNGSAREREHGTAVAALLLGTPGSGHAGLLPEAELFAAEVFSADREGAPYTDAVRLAQGLDWLAAQRVQVVNISLAGPESGMLHTAVRRLVQSGVGVVAAVGNLGPEAPRQYPAAFPEAMAVTAIDRNRKLYARANRGDYVVLAAPGVAIWTADGAGGGAFRDGTSFAAPYVTAAYALLAGAQPGLAPFGLLHQLQQRAKPLADAPALLQAPACKP